MFQYSDVFHNKQRILFVTAHPDDSTVMFGGLIDKLIQDGKDIYVLLATNGARGSRENVISEEELSKQRFAEETASLVSLGVPASHLFTLGYRDGEVESSLQLIGEVAKYIRKYKVDIVCTHEPAVQYAPSGSEGYFVQHRDHRQIGEATIDAVYPFSRDHSFFPEHFEEGIEPHSVYDILLTDEHQPNMKIEITDRIEHKKTALRAHHSQFDEEKLQGIIEAFQEDGRDYESFKYLKLQW